MTVWAVFPSVNPERARKCVAAWNDMGYRVALFVDHDHHAFDGLGASVVRYGAYAGYWDACNRLTTEIMCRNGAGAVVFAADDLYPDPDKAAGRIMDEMDRAFPDRCYVMQPTGDDLDGTQRICGSPWIGSGWYWRAYEGRFPTWPGYHSFYGDEELLHVARDAGCLWQRDDLVQYHDHWSRRHSSRPERTQYQIDNNSKWWEQDKRLFERRKAGGWPGADLLAT